jgi:hypothetical protein
LGQVLVNPQDPFQGQDDPDEEGGDQAEQIQPGADGQAYGTNGPDPGRRGQALDPIVLLLDHPRTQETQTRHHPGRHAGLIAGREGQEGDQAEGGRAQRRQSVGSFSSWLSDQLPLQSNKHSEECSQDQAANHLPS